jgi:hypothetical protein
MLNISTTPDQLLINGVVLYSPSGDEPAFEQVKATRFPSYSFDQCRNDDEDRCFDNPDGLYQEVSLGYEVTIDEADSTTAANSWAESRKVGSSKSRTSIEITFRIIQVDDTFVDCLDIVTLNVVKTSENSLIITSSSINPAKESFGVQPSNQSLRRNGNSIVRAPQRDPNNSRLPNEGKNMCPAKGRSPDSYPNPGYPYNNPGPTGRVRYIYIRHHKTFLDVFIPLISGLAGGCILTLIFIFFYREIWSCTKVVGKKAKVGGTVGGTAIGRAGAKLYGKAATKMNERWGREYRIALPTGNRPVMQSPTAQSPVFHDSPMVGPSILREGDVQERVGLLSEHDTETQIAEDSKLIGVDKD